MYIYILYTLYIYIEVYPIFTGVGGCSATESQHPGGSPRALVAFFFSIPSRISRHHGCFNVKINGHECHDLDDLGVPL